VQRPSRYEQATLLPAVSLSNPPLGFGAVLLRNKDLIPALSADSKNTSFFPLTVTGKKIASKSLLGSGEQIEPLGALRNPKDFRDSVLEISLKFQRA